MIIGEIEQRKKYEINRGKRKAEVESNYTYARIKRNNTRRVQKIAIKNKQGRIEEYMKRRKNDGDLQEQMNR